MLCFLWFHLGMPASLLDIDALVPGQQGMWLRGGLEQDVARAGQMLFPRSAPDGGCWKGQAMEQGGCGSMAEQMNTVQKA